MQNATLEKMQSSLSVNDFKLTEAINQLAEARGQAEAFKTQVNKIAINCLGSILPRWPVVAHA